MIEVKHLTKRYGSHLAVNDLSFTIEKGRIYGLLGPNGAGKSTTMNIITGCLAASSGSVTVDGFDIYENARQAKARLGYLPEQPPLYQDRTPAEYLRFVAEAKGIPAAEIKESITRAMAVTGVEQVSRRLIKNLSKGYRQRVGIAQAILGKPETIILDEPTVGLDPRQIIEIRELIRELGKSHTVLLSSHILSEVQAVCDTVLILSGGRLAACDSPANLERLFSGSSTVELLADCTEKEACSILEPIPGITEKVLTMEGGLCRLTLQSGKPAETLCRQLFFSFAQAQRPILHMTTARASLEEIFIELTAEEKGGA